MQAWKQYLEYLLDPIFQGVNRLFALSYENNAHRKSYMLIFSSNCWTERLQCYDWWKKLFWLASKKWSKSISNKIRKITIGQRDDYTTGCLLDYLYFKNHYKMIAIDVSKQQAVDAEPKTAQQINFTRNLERVLWMCYTFLFCFNIKSK